MRDFTRHHTTCLQKEPAMSPQPPEQQYRYRGESYNGPKRARAQNAYIPHASTSSLLPLSCVVRDRIFRLLLCVCVCRCRARSAHARVCVECVYILHEIMLYVTHRLPRMEKHVWGQDVRARARVFFWSRVRNLHKNLFGTLVIKLRSSETRTARCGVGWCAGCWCICCEYVLRPGVAHACNRAGDDEKRKKNTQLQLLTESSSNIQRARKSDVEVFY